MSTPAIVGDRLYSVSMRPQELALFGEHVRFDLRYAPIADEPNEPLTQHFKLLVLELSCTLPANDGSGATKRLDLAKIGWELELSTDEPCPSTALDEGKDELPRLLERCADTLNELARRAGLEAPIGPEVVARLIEHYHRPRTGQAGAGGG